MKRLLLPALLLTTLTACTATPAGTLPAAAPTPTPASTPAPTAAPAPADALTPEEKIGQLFIIRPDALDRSSRRCAWVWSWPRSPALT